MFEVMKAGNSQLVCGSEEGGLTWRRGVAARWQLGFQEEDSRKTKGRKDISRNGNTGHSSYLAELLSM